MGAFFFEDFRAQVPAKPPIQLETCSPSLETRSPAKVSKKMSKEKNGDTDSEEEVLEGSSSIEPFQNPNISPRYEASTFENSPSPLFSVFVWPLLSRGSSGMGGFSGHDSPSALEPLRVVAANGTEWGEEPINALVEYDQKRGNLGQGSEESLILVPEREGFERWEDSCLVKFSEFLGFSTVGFEKEILGLMRKMVSMQQQGNSEGRMPVSRCARELRKLECSFNYRGQSNR